MFSLAQNDTFFKHNEQVLYIEVVILQSSFLQKPTDKPLTLNFLHLLRETSNQV